MIAFLIILLLTYGYARFEAWSDYGDKMDATAELDHKLLLSVRLCVGAAAATVVGFFWVGPVGFVTCLAGAAALFAPIHRYHFNRYHNRSPLYLGSTNVYDRFWCLMFGPGELPRKSAHHWRNYSQVEEYRELVHRAATILLSFEVAIVLVMAYLQWRVG